MPCEEGQSLWRAALAAALTTLATAVATALVEEARETIKRRRDAKATKPTARAS